MCEMLMPTVENNIWCEENAPKEDCVCVTYKTADWQKMLKYLYDSDGNDAFIPIYPLSAIIESEVQLADNPVEIQPILMDRTDAKDVEYLAKLLNVNTQG
jgi:hypothetical protein